MGTVSDLLDFGEKVASDEWHQEWKNVELSLIDIVETATMEKEHIECTKDKTPTLDALFNFGSWWDTVKEEKKWMDSLLDDIKPKSETKKDDIDLLDLFSSSSKPIVWPPGK